MVNMTDAVTLGALVLAFALLLTVHIATVFGLATRTPRWRAAVALVVPPLAPYWALSLGMRVRGVLWIGALVLYGAAAIVTRLR
jgi:hypothetical protein